MAGILRMVLNHIMLLCCVIIDQVKGILMSEQKVLIDLVVRATQLLMKKKVEMPFVLLEVYSINSTGDEKIILEFAGDTNRFFVQACFGGELKIITEELAHRRSQRKLLYRYY